jgi:hypothetical protein
LIRTVKASDRKSGSVEWRKKNRVAGEGGREEKDSREKSIRKRRK